MCKKKNVKFLLTAQANKLKIFIINKTIIFN